MKVVKVANFRSPLLVSNGQNILKRDFSPSVEMKARRVRRSTDTEQNH
jgi:hypothetical protein